MKKYFSAAVIFFIAVSLYGCKQKEPRINPYLNTLNLQPAFLAMLDTPNYTKIKFDGTLFEFGKLKDGDSASHTFNFKNIGRKPLFINRVSSSCGCTVSDYTREPVFEGESGKIRVTFHSKGQKGPIQKMVTVETNTSNYANHTLYVQGEVMP